MDSNDKRYQQLADYEQTVLPVQQLIADVHWERLKGLVCEEYRSRAAQHIRHAWQETKGQYQGQKIRKYPKNAHELLLDNSCTEGCDKDRLTRDFGGSSLVNYRAYTRSAPSVRIFGIQKCAYLIEKSRVCLRNTWFAQYEAGEKLCATPRLYLAERLNHSSRIASIDLQKAVEHQGKQRYPTPKASSARPSTVGEYANYLAGQPSWTPHELGQLLGNIDYFQRCQQDFHEAEKPASDTLTPPAAPALDTSDLPAFVRKRVDYFPQLLARLAHAPVWDAHEILDEALALYKAGEDDLMQGLKFIHRLTHYLVATPPAVEMRERIESWAFWTKRQEERLLDELMQPAEGKAIITEADRPALEERLGIFKNQDNVEYKRDIGLIEKRLEELDAARLPDAPTVPATLALDIPTPPARAVGWAALLRHPLTLEDFYKVLVEVGLRNADGQLTAQGQNTAAGWVGVFDALLERHYITNNAAGFAAALSKVGKNAKKRLFQASAARADEAENYKQLTFKAFRQVLG